MTRTMSIVRAISLIIAILAISVPSGADAKSAINTIRGAEVQAMAAPADGDLQGPALASNASHCSVSAGVSSSGSRVYATASAYCGSSHYGIVMLKVNGVTRADSGWYTGTWFSASQSRACSPGTTVYVEPFAALFHSNGSSRAAYGGGYSVLCRW